MLKKGKVVGRSWITPLERAMVVSYYAPHCNNGAISNHLTLNLTGGGSIWVKILGCSLLE